ncbi:MULTISPECIES: hypothetical protein [unclassified Bradyrhizobium]|uniref:hypothetical protein n=1 Tax=unclassified Bradyrhizobium TaxID=2631580 RepID=UPI0028E95393|nr:MULTISPECIES: hypothetical protein [unclassified Bradyrhizobium]
MDSVRDIYARKKRACSNTTATTPDTIAFAIRPSSAATADGSFQHPVEPRIVLIDGRVRTDQRPLHCVTLIDLKSRAPLRTLAAAFREHRAMAG